MSRSLSFFFVILTNVLAFANQDQVAGNFIRNPSTGEPIAVHSREEAEYICKSLNKRLPTARELIAYYTKYNIKVADVKVNPDPKFYAEVSSTEQNGDKSIFYFKNFEQDYPTDSQGNKNEDSNYFVFSSSNLADPDWAYFAWCYNPWGTLAFCDTTTSEQDFYPTAVRCVEK
jgi:hypothetical protein